MVAKLFHWTACALLMAAPAAAQTATPPAVTPALAKPSAEDLGALPVLTRPMLSPNGQRIAAEGLSNGKTAILLIDISTPARKISPMWVPKDHEVEWMRWAGNDRLLVSISTAGKFMDEEVRITRLIMVDLVAGKMKMLGPKEQGVDGDDVIFVDRDGKSLLLSTQPTIYDYPAVYRIDLLTLKTERVVASQEFVWTWYADGAGTVRAGMGVDGAKWWLIYRQKAGESFKRTVRINANRGEESPINEFFPVPDSDLGYAVADGKNGRLALFRYDFKTNALGEMVYEHASVDIDTFDTDRAGALTGIFYTDEFEEVVWLDPILKRQQERINKAIPGNISRIVSASEDRGRMLIWSGTGSGPGVYFLLDRKTNEMALFVEPYERLRDKQLSTMEPVRYKARDGLEIRGYLTLPYGRDPKNLPLIVMPHGGPYARDQAGYDPWVQYLAARGYAVLQPNFRGSTGFGRAFVEKGTGQWGRGMQDDLDDGVKWLAGRGTIDAKRVCIMGASYGGYAAQWAAIRNPDIYRCAISFAGVTDIASQLRFSRGSFTASRYFSNWRERVMGQKDFDLDQISPLRQAGRFGIPILIAHGTADDRVPISQSRRLRGALVQANRPHEYVEYKDEGHGFENPVNATDFLVRVGAFLDKYNPPD